MSGSNSLDGQIQIMQNLKGVIESNISFLNTFSDSYKEKIDHCKSLGMMSDYIEPLQNEGFPSYKKRVDNSIDQLKNMKSVVEHVISELEERKGDNPVGGGGLSG